MGIIGHQHLTLFLCMDLKKALDAGVIMMLDTKG